MTREETKALYIELANKAPCGKDWFYKLIKREIEKKNATGNYKLIADIIEECYEQALDYVWVSNKQAFLDLGQPERGCVCCDKQLYYVGCECIFYTDNNGE